MAQQDAPSHSKPHRKPLKRLTDSDRAFALRYRADGLTQTEIAQRLGCDQATISRWLSSCEDTTLAAGAFLRGKALPMAEKVVAKGKPADLIKALQGVNVLQDDRAPAVVVNIGIKDSDVKLALSPPVTR